MYNSHTHVQKQQRVKIYDPEGDGETSIDSRVLVNET